MCHHIRRNDTRQNNIQTNHTQQNDKQRSNNIQINNFQLWHFLLIRQVPISYRILLSIACIFYIENDAEIFPAHYTWKVAERKG